MFPISVLNSNEDGFVVELAVVETPSKVVIESVWPRVGTKLLDSVEEDKMVLTADWPIVDDIS